jgi:peroxiredoxin
MIPTGKTLGLILLGFVMPWIGQAAVAAPQGAAAPDFRLQDTYGRWHALSEYQGKYVVLEWFNHDCPFVKKHYDSHHMQTLQETYTQKGVIWLSINSSAPGLQGNYPAQEANRLSQQKDAHPTAVLIDEQGLVGKHYGAKTTPHIFIINPDGLLLYQGAIDDKPSVDPQDISQAVNYVQKTLDEALSGQPVEIPSTIPYGCSVKY